MTRECANPKCSNIFERRPSSTKIYCSRSCTDGAWKIARRTRVRPVVPQTTVHWVSVKDVPHPRGVPFLGGIANSPGCWFTWAYCGANDPEPLAVTHWAPAPPMPA